MKKNKVVVIFLLFFLIVSLSANLYLGKSELKTFQQHMISDFSESKDFNEIKYFVPPNDAIVGKYHSDKNYFRLSIDHQNEISSVLSNLSKNSSGIQIHFSTDSPTITIDMELPQLNNSKNITSIGQNGVDLYLKYNDEWQFVDANSINGPKGEFILAQNLKGNNDFILNLPLYNQVNEIKIGVGINSNITFKKHFENDNPILVYGTSITQGASASRPGMAYTNILSRHLEREIYNFGFSGNGKFQESIAKIMCQIPASIYLIDSTPNSDPETIKENTYDFCMKLHNCRPDVPIILVESIIREDSFFNNDSSDKFGGIAFIRAQNNALKDVYNKLKKEGVENIFYIEGDNLIGNDHEATVDGTHLSDLGMLRISKIFMNAIIKIEEGTTNTDSHTEVVK